MADQQQNFRLRVRFVKQGRCAMLSHLEIARALERAVRRAGLPYAISQGFSPHMKIAFGAALPVGVGGTEEVFDVQLTEWRNPAEALESLKAASVPDLMPFACDYIGPRDPAASVAFPVSSYEAVFSGPVACRELPESITVVRKKKEKELVLSDYIVGEPSFDGSKVAFTLQALPTGSLRPDLLCAEIVRANPEIKVQTVTRVKQEEVAS